MLQEKILEIIQKNYNEHTGSNEAELHASEEIAEFVESLVVSYTHKFCSGLVTGDTVKGVLESLIKES